MTTTIIAYTSKGDEAIRQYYRSIVQHYESGDVAVVDLECWLSTANNVGNIDLVKMAAAQPHPLLLCKMAYPMPQGPGPNTIDCVDAHARLLSNAGRTVFIKDIDSGGFFAWNGTVISTKVQESSLLRAVLRSRKLPQAA